MNRPRTYTDDEVRALSVDWDAVVAQDEPRECGICGDYTAQGVEVHQVCLDARPPYDVDPRIPDDTWMGLQVDERPKSGAILLYAGIALLLFGAVALWLAMGQR